MLKFLATLTLVTTTAFFFAHQANAADRRAPAKGRYTPKVVIVTMFGPEGQLWLDRLGPWREIRVPGLSPDYPVVHCNRQSVCVLTTGMGHSNAAASTMALVFSQQFDLSHSYFMVAGIAGINPEQGTLGAAAWARYLVDFGIQWEIDARDIPSTWHTGYLGINTKKPDDKPPLDYHTEVFQLNESLLQKAYALSRNAVLSDSTEAQIARAKFGYAPANLAPGVLQCDTLAGDTWFSGTLLGQRASEWTKILTDGKGVYCTTQQEDNATYEALKRGASAKLVDVSRVAVLRTGSDFDRPYAGQTSAANLLDYAAQGGFSIALQNLYLAGNPLVQEITTNWKAWRTGVPAP
ncbi:MAG: purine nucleoside permease [Rhodocyclales bacterium]|nr:purine nucleoside permease [Rhodocyclales bacterium]